MTYAIPTSLYEAALEWKGDRADGRGWKLCCPVGHTWWYIGETEKEKLERLLDGERKYASRINSALDQTRAELVGQKAAKTRFRNQRNELMTKISAGECPCCGKHFQNVREHMKHRHPDALAELDSPAEAPEQ